MHFPLPTSCAPSISKNIPFRDTHNCTTYNWEYNTKYVIFYRQTRFSAWRASSRFNSENFQAKSLKQLNLLRLRGDPGQRSNLQAVTMHHDFNAKTIFFTPADKEMKPRISRMGSKRFCIREIRGKKSSLRLRAFALKFPRCYRMDPAKSVGRDAEPAHHPLDNSSGGMDPSPQLAETASIKLSAMDL